MPQNTELLVGKTIQNADHTDVTASDRDYDCLTLEFTDGSKAEITSADSEGYQSWLKLELKT